MPTFNKADEVSASRRKWQVIHDGASRPMIETPDGRLLSVSEFIDGRWVAGKTEEADCAMIVIGMNLIDTKLRNGADADL